ncbi:MAG: hypothetical protein V7L31_24115 [Nostoc sp.]|uniref:hypothetical protein n=1 Tax=Nostoc sp. TaxID=1180 RepID=UPI002FF3171A
MDNLIDINTLLHRYGLKSRQAIYDRLKDLKIKPARRGKITQDDLLVLDELDKHINSGGTIENFVKSPEVLPVDKLDKLEKPRLDIEFDDDGMSAINVMAELMEKMMSYTYTRNSSPLANYEELEKAVKFEWVLPTSLVKILTGVSPKTTYDSDTFICMGFAFIKTGKIGREAGWQVTKQVASLDLKQVFPAPRLI